MRHGNFHDRISLDLEQCWQEPVHPLEKLQIRRAFPPEHSVTTARIRHRFVGQPIPRPIRHPRRRPAHPRIPPPAGSAAAIRRRNRIAPPPSKTPANPPDHSANPHPASPHTCPAPPGSPPITPPIARLSAPASSRAPAHRPAPNPRKTSHESSELTSSRDHNFIPDLQRIQRLPNGLHQCRKVPRFIVAGDDDAHDRTHQLHSNILPQSHPQKQPSGGE